jgi:membrane-bound serine protease (ClpP class)
MNKRLSISLTFLIVLVSLVTAVSTAFASPSAEAETPRVVTVTLEGPLNPIWREILQRGIDLAEKNQAQALIVELNTTGGSIDLMNELIAKMLDSQVPVVVYVYPQGSMAASAGTLLVLAGDLAAMSPNSIIGAASPVSAQGEDISLTESTKIKEALKATARSLAASRGRKAMALAELAIDDAKAASADEALSVGLVDFIARDENDLLAQLDGRMVMTGTTEHVLQTIGAEIVVTPITVVETVLALLTNANILFILLGIGIQAILIEFSHPGAWVPGFVGAVCLVLAIYGLGLLPVNWVGLLFMLIAFVLFIVDIKAPTHGALTVTGTASFITGGLILFNSATVPSYAHASPGLIVGWGFFLGISFFGIIMLAVRALKRPVATGMESMQGREGYALTKIAPSGIAKIGGEQWSARLAKGSAPVAKDERVVVVEVDGVKMIVKKKE